MLGVTCNEVNIQFGGSTTWDKFLVSLCSESEIIMSSTGYLQFKITAKMSTGH